VTAVFAVVLALSAAAPSALPLDVQYLPQTEDLCGGAAAAMVFRFWGDRHASIESFAPLVDKNGIATDVLVASVRSRGWNVVELPSDSSAEAMLGAQLSESHPVIVLLEDRPHRYHYVVVLGADDDAVIVHDPTWGPFRRVQRGRFMTAWARANSWGMVILPADGDPKRVALQESETSSETSVGAPFQGGHSACDRLLEDAVAEIRAAGLEDAEEKLKSVSDACPESAAPLAELAGVSFAAGRPRDAASWASRALELDPANNYAWDVLGSSRYLEDDAIGALSAWNHLDKPRIDRVVIEGLHRARYALIAQTLPLAPHTLLTPERFLLARERLRELPDQVRTRIEYHPDADGFATVNIAVVERQAPFNRSSTDLIASAASAIVDREVAIALPDASGQGGLWQGGWRWWDNRPRVAFSFTAPRVGSLAGVWRVEGGWEAETFATENDTAVVREERLHAALSLARHFSPFWKYELTIGGDSWIGGDRRMFAGAYLERSAFDERLVFSADGRTWPALGQRDGFHSEGLRVDVRSSTAPSGLVIQGDAGFETVSAAAPLSLWPGAGDGQARPLLLRAHPLLSDGVIRGPVFGRQLAYGNLEAVRWLDKPLLPQIGFALFTDVARVWSPLSAGTGKPFQVDSGACLRVRLPGGAGELNVDYARGLRDGRDAATITWLTQSPFPMGRR
jgi:predicted double-glycine peptidase